MLQIRSSLEVADNTGAKRAWAIGVLGRNQQYARVGDVIKAHIKEASPDGTESLVIRWLPFDEVLAMTLDGQITDALTMMAIQRAAIARLTRTDPRIP